MSSRDNGKQGEAAAEALLGYSGWKVVEYQPLVYGHKLDFHVKHERLGEALVEVKVWGAGGGKDTVKKAIGDAYDLREAGSTLPYILVLSHRLGGLHGAMLRRARNAGVIYEVMELGFILPYDLEDDEP